MTPRWPHLVSLVGAVSVMALGWWWYPTDARRIRAACHDLAQRVSVPPREADVTRVSRLAGLARHFAPDIDVEVEGMEAQIEGRDQVAALAARLSASPLGITVTLDDLEVTIGEDRQSAEARALATAREPDPRGGPDIVEQRLLTLRWSKGEAGWRLAHVLVHQGA